MVEDHTHTCNVEKDRWNSRARNSSSPAETRKAWPSWWHLRALAPNSNFCCGSKGPAIVYVKTNQSTRHSKISQCDSRTGTISATRPSPNLASFYTSRIPSVVYLFVRDSLAPSSSGAFSNASLRLSLVYTRCSLRLAETRNAFRRSRANSASLPRSSPFTRIVELFFGDYDLHYFNGLFIKFLCYNGYCFLYLWLSSCGTSFHELRPHVWRRPFSPQAHLKPRARLFSVGWESQV